MPQLVADVYAEALFSLALEEDALDVYESEIQMIHDVFLNNAEFSAVMLHPQISASEKLSIMETVFKGHVHDNILGLFALVFRKRREKSIPEILRMFIVKEKAHRDVTAARVISAVPLTEEQLEVLVENLSKNLNKKVEVQTAVDESLIGGLKIYVAGKVMDASVKKQMEDLKENLMNLELEM